MSEPVLLERLEKSLAGGKVVVELWCAPDPPTEADATALMRAQSAALREMADGLDMFAVLEVPGQGK